MVRKKRSVMLTHYVTPYERESLKALAGPLGVSQLIRNRFPEIFGTKRVLRGPPTKDLTETNRLRRLFKD
jgi:hypothetical protein